MKYKMPILCYMTDWYPRTIEKGRTAGEVVQERKVLGADNMNWVTWIERNTTPNLLHEKSYFPSMRILFPHLRDNCEGFREIANKIIGALCEKTGKTPSLRYHADPFSVPEKLGTWIDDIFGTSFARTDQPKVFENIFKVKPETLFQE